VGIIPPEDQAKAAKALVKMWPYADPTRLGIWGYSGGGSSTLHAMFRFPDVYAMGMAVAGVPNQRLYDSIYQERYMGSPGENVDGYRRGSPINHVAGLKGKLLIVHGTGDDNVHYQGAEVLINELVAHGKPFSMMAYPNRSHSLSEGPGTTRHWHELLTRYLHENLPVKAPPEK
jgi:dipeptidyl-peptidase-4